LGIILSLVLLGVIDHLLDVLFGKTTLLIGDCDLVGLSGSLVSGVHIEDTVGVDIECNLNLRSTSRGRWDSLKVELSENVVVLGHLSLSFVDLDQHSWLVVSVGGEGLRLLSWDGGVSVDDVCHHSSSGLDTHRKWGNIQKKEFLGLFVSLSGQNGGLDSGSISDGLIWVDTLVKGLSVEEV